MHLIVLIQLDGNHVVEIHADDHEAMEIMVEDRETSTNLIDCGRKFWGAVNDGGGAKSKSKDDKTAEANARTSVTK